MNQYVNGSNHPAIDRDRLFRHFQECPALQHGSPFHGNALGHPVRRGVWNTYQQERIRKTFSAILLVHHDSKAEKAVEGSMRFIRVLLCLTSPRFAPLILSALLIL